MRQVVSFLLTFLIVSSSFASDLCYDQGKELASHDSITLHFGLYSFLTSTAIGILVPYEGAGGLGALLVMVFTPEHKSPSQIYLKDLNPNCSVEFSKGYDDKYRSKRFWTIVLCSAAGMAIGMYYHHQKGDTKYITF